MNKILDIILYFTELFGRFFLAAFVLTVLTVIGGLAVIGGAQMEANDPNVFDELGGYGIIYFMFDVYIPMIIVIPLWILVAFRERQVYNVIKGFIQDRWRKEPIPESWWYIMAMLVGFSIGKFVTEALI